MLLFSVVPARPYPWDVVEVDCILMSVPYAIKVYELVQARMRSVKLVVDSGGYQLLNSTRVKSVENAKLIYEQTLRKLKEFGAKLLYIIQLDSPPKTECLDYVELNVKLFEWSLSVANKLDLQVVPVIHGLPSLVEYYLKYYRNKIRDINIIAIGGLVPLARRKPRQVVELVKKILETLPIDTVHLMGLFMPTLIGEITKVARDLGLKLVVDYAGWRRTAATGLILTPWGYRKVTNVGRGSHAPRPSERVLNYISEICRRYNLSVDLIRISFEERAKFNVCSAMEIIRRDYF